MICIALQVGLAESETSTLTAGSSIAADHGSRDTYTYIDYMSELQHVKATKDAMNATT